ncbi:GAF and ANTAR domain-containing protein [Pseudonocardia sp. NPDC049635]|uniref:GAF and ANTAR domain-containing protein n=1 Tax=Pseudonocardia sp. NPDC049635 TaxID=3155506 RepID=UPI0033D4E26D
MGAQRDSPVSRGEQEWIVDRDGFVLAQERTGHAEDGLAEAGPLARQFTALTGELLASGTVGDVLARVVAAARRVIPAADLVSVTLRDGDGRFHTPVQTGPAASDIDAEQYRSGRGPCVEAARPDGPALAHSDDLRSEERWPEFARAAVRHGYLSVLASSLVPDAAPPRLPGALNVYGRGTDAFAPADRDRLLLLSTHASLALATCTAVSAAELQEAQLRQAIASRDVIGQAKGILMARRGLTAEAAFDVLRRTSQDLNVKLVELAGTLAARPSALDGE